MGVCTSITSLSVKVLSCFPVASVCVCVRECAFSGSPCARVSMLLSVHVLSSVRCRPLCRCICTFKVIDPYASTPWPPVTQMGVYSRSTWPWPFELPWRRWSPPPPGCGSLCWLSLPWCLVYRGWHRGDLEEKHNLWSYSGSTSRYMNDLFNSLTKATKQQRLIVFIGVLSELSGSLFALFCLFSLFW